MGLRLTLNQLPDGGEGSIPSRLTKKKEIALIILIVIIIVLYGSALCWALSRLDDKAEEEAVLEQVARLSSAQAQLNRRLDEFSAKLAAQNPTGKLDEMEARLAEFESALVETNGRLDELPDGKRMRYLSESLDAAIKQCGELDEIKRRLEELESDTAGGNAALDQMFLAGINGIMNYGMKDAVKRG